MNNDGQTWEEYLIERKESAIKLFEQKLNAPCMKDIQTLATDYISNGYKSMVILFNKIIVERKLTRIESLMLQGKLETMLRFNGYIIKK